MLKLTLQLKEVEDTMNIALLDPTKKQLDSASENERILAQLIKNVLDSKLLELLEEQNKRKNN